MILRWQKNSGRLCVSRGKLWCVNFCLTELNSWILMLKVRTRFCCNYIARSNLPSSHDPPPITAQSSLPLKLNHVKTKQSCCTNSKMGWPLMVEPYRVLPPWKMSMGPHPKRTNRIFVHMFWHVLTMFLGTPPKKKSGYPWKIMSIICTVTRTDYFWMYKYRQIWEDVFFLETTTIKVLCHEPRLLNPKFDE